MRVDSSRATHRGCPHATTSTLVTAAQLVGCSHPSWARPAGLLPVCQGTPTYHHVEGPDRPLNWPTGTEARMTSPAQPTSVILTSTVL